MADLLKIRQLKGRKLERAQTELRKAIRQLNALQDALANKQTECEEYRQWRIQEETRLYHEIDHKVLSPAQLDELRERIASMHEQESQHRARVLELQNAVNDAQAHKAHCTIAVKQAEKNIEKYDELIDASQRDARTLLERQSEELLDEFASATLERNKHGNAPH